MIEPAALVELVTGIVFDIDSGTQLVYSAICQSGCNSAEEFVFDLSVAVGWVNPEGVEFRFATLWVRMRERKSYTPVVRFCNESALITRGRLAHACDGKVPSNRGFRIFEHVTLGFRHRRP
jgi:hypothetical protein